MSADPYDKAQRDLADRFRRRLHEVFAEFASDDPMPWGMPIQCANAAFCDGIVHAAADMIVAASGRRPEQRRAALDLCAARLIACGELIQCEGSA